MRAREELRSAEHVLGKRVCPRYGHPRRAGAPKSQGKPREGDQSGQPSQPPGALEPRQEMSCSTGAGAREEIAGLQRGLPGRSSRTSQRGRQCKRRPLWKILHSPQGWQTQKPWGAHAAKVNREWGGLWLCRAHINARKCLSFSFLVAKHFCMSAEPLICNPDGLSTSPICRDTSSVSYTHTHPALLRPLPQSGLYVCFLCRPQPRRRPKGYLIHLLHPVPGMADSGHRVDRCPLLHTSATTLLLHQAKRLMDSHSDSPTV